MALLGRRRCHVQVLLLLFVLFWITLIWTLVKVSSKDSGQFPGMDGEAGGDSSVRGNPGQRLEKGLLLKRLLPLSKTAPGLIAKGGNRTQIKSGQSVLGSPPFPISDWASVPARYDVHIFYYPWYGTESKDGLWLHWNHRLLPHWNHRERGRWPEGAHVPPADIAASFYPRLGPYSSSDPSAVVQHMQEICYAGVGVVVMTWYPPNLSDPNGHPVDPLTPLILDTAHQYGLKVALHIEPYTNRNAETMQKNIQYIIDSYGGHPAFYRQLHRGTLLPVYYVYDSYLNPKDNWQQLLLPGQAFSVRSTPYDGIFLGLVVKEDHLGEVKESGFDGFYTYFAVKEFSYGSNWDHWGSMASFARTNSMLFVPSVGPGYNDTRVRPWNGGNSRDREHGEYYSKSFRAAIGAAPDVISITSFNEWHEGTQIEAAVPMKSDQFQYRDYKPEGPLFYLQLTQKLVKDYAKEKEKEN